ncbi:MAG: thioredoxin fold domain-containing protein [Saprospiraceae bacterium]|nr:thioredoxin fold domain-containing protein [Saprospiraceae bacterium]
MEKLLDDMRLLLLIWLLGCGTLWAQPTPRPGQTIKVSPMGTNLYPESRQPKNAKNRTIFPETSAVSPATVQPTEAPGTASPPSGAGKDLRQESRSTNLAAPQTAPSLTRPAEPVGVQWMTIEEAVSLQRADQRKIFIDVYTDGCSECKKMDLSTFGNAAVCDYLNQHYYPVRFNAEQKESIAFKGETYRYVRSGSGGHHELAALWLLDRLNFPTCVFLDENLDIIQPIPGYQDAEKLLTILQYFGTDSHRTTPWETFEKQH